MIKKLFIKNFRSIGPEGVIIDFNANLNALVGKNNVGKSNLLAAIDYVLGGYWPSDSKFALEDFYQKNVNNDIGICVLFKTPLEHQEILEGWFEHKVPVCGFKLTYKTYKRNTIDHKKGELHLDYTCVNAKGEDIRIPTLAPTKKRTRAEYIASFTRVLKVNKILRQQIEVVFIPANRDILKFSPSNAKSLLGILLKEIRDNFKQDLDIINLEKGIADFLGVEDRSTRHQLFEAFIKKANDTLKTDDLVQLSVNLAKYVKEHLGEQRTKDLAFNFNVQDEWTQFKFLELSIMNNGVSLPVHKLGNGFQSLIVISIFRTYLEIKGIKPIFLIEEPEMYLHTHAKKYFYSILETLAQADTQIFYTTHATEFVDIICSESVKRIVSSENTTRILPAKPVQLDFQEDELLKLNTAINQERAELFFAEKVILVEGETEKVVFDYLLRLKGIDPNLHDISIIETAGKGNMPRYIKLLESLEIPFVVVFDTDIFNLTGNVDTDLKIKTNNKDAQTKNENIKAATSKKDCLFANDPFFEVEVGIAKLSSTKKDSKPLAAIQFFKAFETYEVIKAAIPKCTLPIERLLES